MPGMRKRKPKIILGTPPTPENPWPSNQITEEHSDGTSVTRMPPATEEFIREYEQAIRDYPEDASVRLHFAIALQGIGDLPDAIVQATEAIRLRPDWEFAHSILGFALYDTGDLPRAISHLREALRLSKPDQGETTVRWGLSKALRDAGEITNARSEIESAVALQRDLISAESGSPRLLRQLEEELARYG